MQSIPKKVIDEVLIRSGGLCEYIEMGHRCCRYDPWRRALHHIKKRSQGGLHTPENIILLCGYHHSLAHGIKESGEQP